jgi:type III secretion protein N (ATPase)
MGAVTDREHRAAASRFRELLARYQEVEMLIRLGEYQPGGDATADEAVAKIEQLRAFLRQGTHERSSFDETRHRLAELVGRGVA